MTMQRRDPFIWKGKTYSFLRAENIYTLFDPEAFGLHPQMMDTSCYKGFVISFRVKRKQLYIDRLEVYCADGVYPEINGKAASAAPYGAGRLYEDLDLPVDYSGTVIIGNDLKEQYQRRAFIGPHSFRETYELTFENGRLTAEKRTDGEYFGF